MLRFKSAERLRPLFTSAYPKPLYHPNPLRRSMHGGGNGNGGAVDRKPLPTELSKKLFHPHALSRSMHGGAGDGVEREVLPPEIARSVVRLTCESRGKSCDIYLIGTDPNSQEYYKELGAVINTLKPEVVFMGSSPRHALDLNPVEVQTEFQVETQKYGGKVIFGDLPGHITSYRGRPSRLSHLFSPGIFFNEKRYRIIWTIEFRDKFPGYLGKWLSDNLSFMKEISSNDRDRYISAALLNVAREHKSVVAIVSNCHLPGVQKYWNMPTEKKQPWTFGDNVILSALLAMRYIKISGYVY